jgi:predicted nucleic acid-binding protein
VKALLDTCVVSEVTKPRPEPGVATWLAAQDEADLFLSALTLGEIRKGVERLPDSGRKDALRAWLETDLPARFRGRVLPVDARVAEAWGVTQAHATRTLPAIDSLLAATARAHGLVVVTRNEADFDGCGVDLLNPWTAAPP